VKGSGLWFNLLSFANHGFMGLGFFFTGYGCMDDDGQRLDESNENGRVDLWAWRSGLIPGVSILVPYISIYDTAWVNGVGGWEGNA